MWTITKPRGRRGRKSNSASQMNPGRASRRRQSGGVAPMESLEDRTYYFATNGAWGQPGGPGSPVVLRYSYSNLLNGGLPTDSTLGSTAAIRSAIQEALGLWSAVAPLQFTEVADSGPGVGDGAYFGNFPEIRFGHEFIDGAPTGSDLLAHAFFPNFITSTFFGALAGDVHFDNGNTWGVTASGTSFDLVQAATHEIGHALGLDHVPLASAGGIDAVMNQGMNGKVFSSLGKAFGGLGAGFLLPDDVAGIRANYGAGLGWVLDSSGILHVNGTDNSDTISITTTGGFLNVSSAGNGSFVRSLGGVLGIAVTGRAGNDVVNVDFGAAGIPITITGDAGNDTVNVTPGTRNLAFAGGAVSFDGGAGTDALVVDDSGNSASSTYTATAGALGRNGWAGATYSNTEALTLRGAAVNATYNVNSLALAQSLTITDGPGVDTLNVASAGQNLGTISGNLSFAAAGSAGNWVYLFDQSNPDADRFTFTGKSVQRTTVGALSFGSTSWFGSFSWQGNVSFLQVFGGGGSNTFDVSDTSVFRTNVSGGGGNDSVRLTPSAGWVNFISGQIYFDGGSGADSIYVNDTTSGSISDGDWTLDGTSLDKTTAPQPGALVSWAGGTVESLRLDGGGWGTRYTVTGVSAGMTATINAGGGDDTLDVGSAVAGYRTVDGIQGTLNLNGQGGVNTLNYNDADNNWVPIYLYFPGYTPPPARGDSYTLNGTTVRRSNSGPANYAGIQTLNLNGGTAANDFWVTPSPWTTFNVNGNDPTPAFLTQPSTSQEWDRLTVDYSGTLNPTLTFNRYGQSGWYTFGDRMPVNFTGMEYYNSPPTVYVAPLRVYDPGTFSTPPVRLEVLP